MNASGVFSTSGDTMNTSRGYDEFIEGCSSGDTMSTWRIS